MTERRQLDLQPLRERVDARLKLLHELHVLTDDLNRFTLEKVRQAAENHPKTRLHGAADRLAITQLRQILSAIEHEGVPQQQSPLLSKQEMDALFDPEH